MSEEIVTTDLVGEINRLHAEILEAARTTIEKAIRIGELLTQAKASLKHGQWLPWLEANVAFNRQSAANYMRVYDRREEIKCTSVVHLTDAYALLAGPKKVEITDAAAEITELAVFEPDGDSLKSLFAQVSELKGATAEVLATLREFLTLAEDTPYESWGPLVDQYRAQSKQVVDLYFAVSQQTDRYQASSFTGLPPGLKLLGYAGLHYVFDELETVRGLIQQAVPEIDLFRPKFAVLGKHMPGMPAFFEFRAREL